MENNFKKFIEELARRKVPKNVFNQYSYDLEENSIRRDNLFIYLKEIQKLNPKIMLVAEAPGYKGSRVTGVPLTSEYLLMNNIKNLDFFDKKKGYKLPRGIGKLSKQATTTIIWNLLAEYKIIPLSWNAFPFHPYKEGNQKSNRTPTKKELLIGEKFILKILEMFDIKEIVSVGNKAKSSLDKLSIESTKVRHPAQGGKNKFIEGMSESLENWKD